MVFFFDLIEVIVIPRRKSKKFSIATFAVKKWIGQRWLRFISTIVTGPAASPRVQKYIKYDDWRGLPRAFFNMVADLTYEGCIFFQQRLVLAALSGKPVKLKNLRAVEDDPGLKGVSTTELILEITAFSAAYFSYI